MDDKVPQMVEQLQISGQENSTLPSPQVFPPTANSMTMPHIHSATCEHFNTPQKRASYASAKLTAKLRHEPEPKLGQVVPADETRERCAKLQAEIHRLCDIREKHIGLNWELEMRLTECRMYRDSIFWKIFRINDLPQELLTNIFRYVAWSSSRPSLNVNYRLWLTWTCRAWRRATLQDTTLWSAVWFRDRMPFLRSMAWIERAGTAPLDIRISELDDPNNVKPIEEGRKFTGDEMSFLMDLLAPKFSQIRMLICVIDTWSPALVILNRLRTFGDAGKRLNVERFELHRAGRPFRWIGPGYQEADMRNPIPLLGSAQGSHLKYLCLNGVAIDWNSASLSNLTCIDIRRIALESSPDRMRFRDLLRASPNLNKLVLDGAGPQYSPVNVRKSLPPVRLEKLRVLLLGNYSLDYAVYVLQQIDAPNVRDLTLLDMQGEDYARMIESMTGMFPDVRLLTLYTVEVSPTPDNLKILVGWLHSMQNLRYLRLATLLSQVLEAFLVDPRVYGLSAPNPPVVEDVPFLAKPGNSCSLRGAITCPRFDILEYQRVAAELVVRFGHGRSLLGLPLRKIYVNGPWVSDISNEHRVQLGDIAQIFIAPHGADTAEENDVVR